MLGFEPKKWREGESPSELEIHMDEEGLNSLLAHLQFLKAGKTEHVNLMSEAWGGNHLNNSPRTKGTASMHHVKIQLA